MSAKMLSLLDRASWKLVLVPAVAGLLVWAGTAQTETCTMYQKYVKDYGNSTYSAGTLCANQGADFVEVTPSGGSGTYYARAVPMCDDTGKDTPGCANNPVRSLDGTRAFYYIDPAPSSNHWVIFFPGGGSCGKMDGLNAAEACYANGGGLYFDSYDVAAGDACEMTSHHASGACRVAAQKDGTGQGILDPGASNPFWGHNRVWMNKSTFDRFMGNITNTKAYGSDDLELFFHGRRLIRAMLKDLDRANRSITVGNQTIPDLSDAETIVLVGESGGAGGLIHNAEWLVNRVREVSGSAKVNFLPSSRMLHWLEAEAYFAGSGSIWDDVDSGTSTILKNAGSPGSNGVITYSPDTFQGGGAVRELLDSWGDFDNPTNLYLDPSCKAAHPDAATNKWKCYDEGHVALYHMDENAFFFESLYDATHVRDASPTFWIDTVDFGSGVLSAYPGFVWDPPGSWSFTDARRERILYTMDSILLNPHHRGARGFYAPSVACHTCLTNSNFSGQDLSKGSYSYSLAAAFYYWQSNLNNNYCSGSDCDWAVIQDGGASYQITFTNGLSNTMGGGWVP